MATAGALAAAAALRARGWRPTTRVPAQRLYAFDRSGDNASRAELVRACEVVDELVSRFHGQDRVVGPVEIEVVRQRKEIARTGPRTRMPTPRSSSTRACAPLERGGRQ